MSHLSLVYKYPMHFSSGHLSSSKATDEKSKSRPKEMAHLVKCMLSNSESQSLISSMHTKLNECVDAPLADRQRQVDPWSTVSRQPRLHFKFQMSVR